jgi:hypothetical protein
MTQTEIQIVIELSAIGLGLYLAFFKSYFKERGKIMATKKDIEIITEKVEKIKSDIGILTHKKITLSTEKQNALIDFNEKYSAWLNYIMHVSLNGYVETADNYILKVNEKLDQLFYDYIISEAKIDLFFNTDNELNHNKEDVKQKTIELLNILRIYLIKAGVEVKCLAISENHSNFDRKIQEIEKHNKLLFEIIKECQENKLEQFKIIVPAKWKLVEIISARVYDFENK